VQEERLKPESWNNVEFEAYLVSPINFNIIAAWGNAMNNAAATIGTFTFGDQVAFVWNNL
jgi:hypothetical protein